MHLTRKHLSRRTLLKGAGFSVGLPLLDAMIPAATALAKTAAAPKLRAASSIFPTARSCGTRSMGRRWITGPRAVPVRISSSAQFSSRSRSTSTQ